MELVLQDLQWHTCLVYVDDIIVYSADFSEHKSRVDEVLSRVGGAGLKLRPGKCNLLQTEVTFLGHIESKEGVRPNPMNIAKVADWPRPTTAKQVKAFVATGSYYRRYVEDFAKIARPLSELTKKDAIFYWTPACQVAFETLKEKLTGADIKGYPLNEGVSFTWTSMHFWNWGSVVPNSVGSGKGDCLRQSVNEQGRAKLLHNGEGTPCSGKRFSIFQAVPLREEIYSA
ncbi:uncharacterized protein LOC128552760 [Mercenaria mercenaria]|uniref:uncharacterized protein LOC128552760 n=1 Tax=Mercenaria mercenaria TaxID=6596 RepID=UPI00234F7E75|nr:uncharacterized protein LOC128552760 [Mercenaria mercenaria]